MYNKLWHILCIFIELCQVIWVAIARKETLIMNKNTRKTQVEYQKKYLEQFEGSYVYYIIDKRTQRIVYAGETGNIVKRYGDHFNTPTMKSSFSYWCIENDEEVTNYQMLVLDLTDIEELDFEDRLLIEKMLQYFHKATIINKRVPKKLEAYEIERFEYIVGLIDFDFRPYLEVKVSKMATKKVLSDQTKDF